MKRLILVCFAFLAWVFYQLSDGADFEPRRAATEAPAQTTTSPSKQPVKAATLVASPAISPPRSVPDPVEPAPVEPAAVTVTTPPEPDIQAVAQLNQIRSSLSQGLSLFPETDPIAQPLMLASLEQGVTGMSVVPSDEGEATEPAAIEPVPTPPDIREIVGTRVNMRDGPGTTFPILTRLTLGREVEVLGKSGTGWLRLRILPERQVGWISASLVSKAKR